MNLKGGYQIIDFGELHFTESGMLTGEPLKMLSDIYLDACLDINIPLKNPVIIRYYNDNESSEIKMEQLSTIYRDYDGVLCINPIIGDAYVGGLGLYLSWSEDEDGNIVMVANYRLDGYSLQTCRIDNVISSMISEGEMIIEIPAHEIPMEVEGEYELATLIGTYVAIELDSGTYDISQLVGKYLCGYDSQGDRVIKALLVSYDADNDSTTTMTAGNLPTDLGVVSWKIYDK